MSTDYANKQNKQMEISFPNVKNYNEKFEELGGIPGKDTLIIRDELNPALNWKMAAAKLSKIKGDTVDNQVLIKIPGGYVEPKNSTIDSSDWKTILDLYSKEDLKRSVE